MPFFRKPPQLYNPRRQKRHPPGQRPHALLGGAQAPRALSEKKVALELSSEVWGFGVGLWVLGGFIGLEYSVL